MVGYRTSRSLSFLPESICAWKKAARLLGTPRFPQVAGVDCRDELVGFGLVGVTITRTFDRRSCCTARMLVRKSWPGSQAPA